MFIYNVTQMKVSTLQKADKAMLTVYLQVPQSHLY